jgi:acetoin utilization deacetylase AcuC-like enzyme
MLFFQDDRHRLHFPQGELSGGQFQTPYERPSRVEYILRRLTETGFAPGAPGPLDWDPIRKVHDAGYLAFLETAWAEWVAEGFKGEIIAAAWPTRRMAQKCPRNIDGKVGYYAQSAETAMTVGTWGAAQASCALAQSAVREVASGARAAFALCRPPGHHAMSDMYGGYCFINNAGVAAQMMLDGGAAKVAVLDIDFHHGNGTQDIFYDRNDVFYASIHGAPEDAYPYFLGYADEVGAGDGIGANMNLPLPPGAGYEAWSGALDAAIARTREVGAEALVVSLGVDAFKEDPISFFKLDSPDFHDAGRRIAALNLPTVFVMEGGYAVEAVGINTVNVLQGFEA